MKQKQMFFWKSLAFSIIQQMLAICSLVPLPFLKPAWTFDGSWFMYCWSLAWRILSFTLLACEVKWSCWVLSDFLQPHGLQPTRLLHPWDFPGESTEVGCHILLQGNLPNPGIESRSPALQVDALPSEPPRKPTSIWDECNCAVVWAFFGIAFLWDWNENGPFPVLQPL